MDTNINVRVMLNAPISVICPFPHISKIATEITSDPG
jgi:hypothetical protein